MDRIHFVREVVFDDTAKCMVENPDYIGLWDRMRFARGSPFEYSLEKNLGYQLQAKDIPEVNYRPTQRWRSEY